MSTSTHTQTPKSAGSVKLSQRTILLDGAPHLVLAGEVHYFRLHPEDWENRLELLQKNGMDTVATYIPWIWHELSDGKVDLDGTTHPQRNVRSFLQLCADRGLNVIVRPGPFCMAELKNEGIPYRLYKPPFVQPMTWDGEPVKTRTRDYLADDFLHEVYHWYGKVMPLIASFLKPRGGPVIAVQLDNEIGMLQWVSNCPDLSDESCEQFRNWLRAKYPADEADSRLGADSSSLAATIAAMRSPQGNALALHHDLGLFMRERFKAYVAYLRVIAERFGVKDVPFLINIHGTGGGRGLSFPIGISQLFRTYENESQMTSGSDLYLGDLTVSNVADLYLANAFMLSMHSAEQPLTSLEFEVGNGNYGDDLGTLYTPEAAELKARLCVAQGNKLLNFYIHCGGENPHLDSVGDGIDRIAFTGQRHGFAAPVDPEGHLDATYHALGRMAKSMKGIEHLLADCRQEFDDISIGFVPDHYLTEYHYSNSLERAEQIAELERFRGRGPRDILARALLLCGFSMAAVNLQKQSPTTSVHVLATGRTLSRKVQLRLVDYVSKGGKLVLVGLLPDRDHDGAPCTVLADACGLKSAGQVFDAVGPNGNYWPSVRAQGWAAPRPEVRVTVAQLLEPSNSSRFVPFLTEIQTGLPCAGTVRFGDGAVVMLGCDYPADLSFYRDLLETLDVVPTFQLEADGPGIIVTPTISSNGRRLLHIINVAPQAVSFKLRRHGKRMFFGKRLVIPARTGWALPFAEPNAEAEVCILESTAEIAHEGRHGLKLRPTQDVDRVVLLTKRKVHCKVGKTTRKGNRVCIRVARKHHRNKAFHIRFSD